MRQSTAVPDPGERGSPHAPRSSFPTEECACFENRGRTIFGAYLREVRRRTQLSLAAVVRISAGMPAPITKSHLSRIENGFAEPTFPKLLTLSRIYGVSLASLAERFEDAMQRRIRPPVLDGKVDEEIISEGRQLIQSGRFLELLSLSSAALERIRRGRRGPRGKTARRTIVREYRLMVVDCLNRLSQWQSGKVECEKILSEPCLSARHKLIALELFVQCALRLGQFAMVTMGIEALEAALVGKNRPPRFRPDLLVLRANMLRATGRAADAVPLNFQALGMYKQIPIRYEACRARLNLADSLLESGRAAESDAYLKRTIAAARSAGYRRLEAIAVSDLAARSFQKEDLDAAERCAIRSNIIARPLGFYSVVFQNCYYLWRIALARGDPVQARVEERALKVYAPRAESCSPERAWYLRASSNGTSRLPRA